MGGPTGQDEAHEQIGDPSELQVGPIAQDHGDRQGNREIGQADNGVGRRVHGDQAGRPTQAKTVRRQAGRVEQPVPQRHVAPPWLGGVVTRACPRASGRDPESELLFDGWLQTRAR